MVTERLTNIVSNPQSSLSWLKRVVSSFVRRLRNGHFFEAGEALIGLTIGWSTYLTFLRRRNDTYVIRAVRDNRMALDLTDPGISQSLLIHGIREPESTQMFEQKLAELQEKVNQVTVLDVGANIGYYTLIEADILEPNGRIFAFEPSPDNVSILERNVRLNGYTDLVDVHQVAVGSVPGTSTLQLTESSNTHHIKDTSESTTNAESLEVDTINLIEFLDGRDIAADEVNVLRMDVEGFEYEILPTVAPILQGDQPFIAFIEFHADSSNRELLKQSLDTFFENGCEIVSVVDYYDGLLEITSRDELSTLDNFELIVTRNL